MQRLQLTEERAPLDVFVRRHLERETIYRRQTKERRLLVAARAAASPEGPIRQLQREALAERSLRLRLTVVLRIGKAAPRRAHRERRDASEIALRIAGVVQLRDRVLHFGLARDAEVQGGQ